MKYKYHLLRYKGPSSRLTCPNCGRKRCFVPYVDGNEQIAGEEYGRCNHESSCGYSRYPPSEQDWQPSAFIPKRQYQPKKSVPTICAVPQNIVKRTIRMTPRANLLTFLSTIFSEQTISYLVEEYQIGVTKSKDTIFYQIDTQGRCRTGKVMKYNPQTGHRIKDTTVQTPITWVHSLLKQQGVLPQEWELTQCLFGEHLLPKYPDKPVCLVEAEKTAVLCAGLMPECIWVAVGGKTQLGDKVEVLEGRTVIAFPDTDGYEKWKEKIAERPHLNIQLSDYLEHNATDEDRTMGADIADILIRWKRTSGQSLTEISPIAEEIRRYISPEYWSAVQSLVEELDLQFVRAIPI